MKQALALAVGAAIIIGMAHEALSLNTAGKVMVCHNVGKGKNAKGHVIEISENAVQAHLDHGDSLEAAAGLKAGDSCSTDAIVK